MVENSVSTWLSTNYDWASCWYSQGSVVLVFHRAKSMLCAVLLLLLLLLLRTIGVSLMDDSYDRSGFPCETEAVY